MKRRLFLALVTSVAVIATAPTWARDALPKASPEQVGMSAQKLERIREVLKQEIEQGKLPGTVVMVARKGKLVYADAVGFQDKETGQPMALDSVFRIYSMTKPLVSVAAMMLVEDGKIQLTDPVSKFLPAFKGQQVSVRARRCRSSRASPTRHVAGRPRDDRAGPAAPHRRASPMARSPATRRSRTPTRKAGVYLPGVRDYDSRDMTPAEQVERVGKAPLAHQPGTRVGIQPRVRHARPRGRGGVRQAARRFPRRAAVQAAEDGRHRFLGAGRQDRRAWRSRWRPTSPAASRSS